jgi:lysophospholipase L1-like esterase
MAAAASHGFRRVALVIGAECVLLAVLALAIEGLSRAAIALDIVRGSELRARGNPVVRPHPFLGFCLRENATRNRGTDECQIINKNGYRGEPVGPKAPGAFRVLCVGDSVMYGDNLAEADTLPARLEELLRLKAKDRRIEVVNAGVLQYTSAETLASLMLRGLDLKPDVVIFYQGANDVAPRLVRPFRPDYSHYRAVWEKDFTERADRELEASDGYVTLRWLAGVYPAARQIDAFTVKSLPKTNPEEQRLAFYRSGEDTFLRNEAAGVALARSAGARSLIVSTIYNEKRRDSSYYLVQMLEANKRKQGNVAKQQGANFLELPAELNNNEQYFRDNVHFSRDGARAVAGRIAAEIEKLGWLPK